MRPSNFLTIVSVTATASASAVNLPVSDPIPIFGSSTFPISLPGSVPTGGASPSLPVSETSVSGKGASPSLPVSVTSLPGIGASPSLPVSVPSVPSTTGAPSVPAVPTDPTELLANIQSAIQILEVVTALSTNQKPPYFRFRKYWGGLRFDNHPFGDCEKLVEGLGSCFAHWWDDPWRGCGLAL